MGYTPLYSPSVAALEHRDRRSELGTHVSACATASRSPDLCVAIVQCTSYTTTLKLGKAAFHNAFLEKTDNRWPLEKSGFAFMPGKYALLGEKP